MSTGDLTNGGPRSADEPASTSRLSASRWLRYRVVALCAFTGALGVLCGYAGFMLYWRQIEHDRLWNFVIALAMAGLFALIIEGLRELIKHGSFRKLPYWPLSRLIVTLLMLTVFELFVMAGHGSFEDPSELLHEAARTIISPALSGTAAESDLYVVGGLWVVVGAILAGWLARLIFQPAAGIRQQVLNGIKTGALAGAVVAPLALFAYVIMARLLAGFGMFFCEPERFWRLADNVLSRPKSGELGDLLPLARPFIDTPLAGLFWIVLLGLLLAGTIALAQYCGKRRGGWVTGVFFKGMACLSGLVGVGAAIPLALVLGAIALFLFIYLINLLFVIFGSLVGDIGHVITMLAMAAVIWCAPGIFLGALVPLLQRPSQTPKLWAPVAFLSGAVLVGLTFLRVLPLGFLVPGALLLASSFLLGAGRRVEEYWPVVALSIAMILCGMTRLVQMATFSGVFERMHLVLVAPVPEVPDVSWQAKLSGLSTETSRWMESVTKQVETGPGSGAVLVGHFEKKVEEFFKMADERIAKDAVGRTNVLERVRLKLEPLDSSVQRLLGPEVPLRDRNFAKETFFEYAEPYGFLVSNINETCAFRDACRAMKDKHEREYREVIAKALKADFGPQGDGRGFRYLIAAQQKQDGLSALARANDKYDVKMAQLTKCLTDSHAAWYKRAAEMLPTARNLQAVARKLDETLAQRFELILTGSLGFWVTIGLLAGWRIQKTQTRDSTAED